MIPVANGEAALAEFEKRGDEIDVLVMDQAMPGGHRGTEVVRAIRRLSPGFPAIIISGPSRECRRRGVAGRGTAAAQPFAPQRLAEAIWALLRGA